MRSAFIVFRWEIRKLITNWRKALTVFLLPALLMMAALNVFPMLINYMTTGSLGSRPVLVTNAPDSFREYTQSGQINGNYRFEFISQDDLTRSVFEKEISRNRLIVSFTPETFDDNITDYYRLLADGFDTDNGTRITLYYDENSFSMYTKAAQFEEDVLSGYRDHLLTAFGGRYAESGGDMFTVDGFNPVTDIVKYRSAANEAAARVIPGVIVLLLYYCVYSLSCDMFAAERDRGFLRKLLLTPVSPQSLFAGKIAAITAVASISALVTFTVLFFASWLNRSNDAMSLLPFGMLLTPAELFCFIITIPPTAFVMTAICIKIIFSLTKTEDILVNLQLPLVLLLAEFFLQMIRFIRPFTLEFMFPIHGTICALRDVFATDIRWYAVVLLIATDIITGMLLLRSTFRNREAIVQ